jgi:hypothetical protein
MELRDDRVRGVSEVEVDRCTKWEKVSTTAGGGDSGPATHRRCRQYLAATSHTTDPCAAKVSAETALVGIAQLDRGCSLQSFGRIYLCERQTLKGVEVLRKSYCDGWPIWSADGMRLGPSPRMLDPRCVVLRGLSMGS